MSVGASGFDLHASLEEEVNINPGGFESIPTGIIISLPVGYEAQVRPRSGLSRKHGITVLNAPGTVDADYRGEVMVILVNHGKKPFKVKNGMRIAQMVVSTVEVANFVEVEAPEELDATEREDGGFGHTGI